MPITKTPTIVGPIFNLPNNFILPSRPVPIIRRNILQDLEEDKSSKKRCRCGSDNHLRTNHSTCILNRKNIKNLIAEEIKKLENEHAARNSVDESVNQFQKRGLPHAHILIIMEDDSKPRCSEDYDLIVSTEIPDKLKYPQA